jgi:hypothetical protein
MKPALVLVAILSLLGCRLQMAGKWDSNGPHGSYSGSIADVRISQGIATTDEEGTQTAMDKLAASPQFMGMVEKVAPEVIDLLGLALMARGAGTVSGALEGLIAGSPEGVIEEIGKEIGEEMPTGMVKRERQRRSAEKKEAKRRKREARKGAQQ